jgi:superfamily II DNA or RNA helicase
MIFERGVEPTVLTAEGSSNAAKKRREDAIQGMRDGRVPILIATSLLDEGISINRLSRVLLALPQKAKGGTQQRTGRSMRLFEGKSPKIIDFVDRNVETLVRRFKERMKVYREIGFIGSE